MPVSILPQNHTKSEIFPIISSFLSTFKIGALLRKCNAKKERGVSLLKIFQYKFCSIFNGRSMYMQQKTGTYQGDFSKNTFYRFLNDPKINWLRFTSLLSKSIADTIEPLTNEERVNAFVVDDSLFERTGCKKTELASKVFDHVSMKFSKGYRLMTVGWTDGNTFLPINSSLLASSKDENRIGPTISYDKRSLAYQRRALAQRKGTDVMIELLKNAKNAGFHANHVLFDTWFSNPAQLLAVKNLGLDSIAMVKKSSRIFYEFEEKNLSIKKIFNLSKKRRGRSKYLLSLEVMVGKEQKIPAKLVFVRNRNNKKDWIAFVSTDLSLSEEEIIRIYGKRWQIEIFFKTCKTYLRLTKECHSLSYDALTAHVAIVFARYLMLAVEQRRNEDWRTMGELFFYVVDELADITFKESFQLLLTIMKENIRQIFHPTKEQMEGFVQLFFSQLPSYLHHLFIKEDTNCLK